MNKLRRSLPLLILILVLAFFLYPSGNTPASPAAVPAAGTADTLNLVSPVSPSSATGTSSETDNIQPSQGADNPAASSKEEEALLPEDGCYTTREDVALYLHQYGHLPSNFITKKEAREAGWPGGSLEEYCPGKCIGGDYFGNNEGLLPKAKGRTWKECDIDTLGKRTRGPKRIIFSNDGLIFYTDDHYESYTQLY